MREQVRAFIETAALNLEFEGPVYEFGSYLVEGQQSRGDLRPFFPGLDYVGCDMRPGPGVDRIEDLGALTLADGSAGAIICVDTLEHVFEARRAVEEMLRALAPGGVILLAAPMDFRLHDYPSDYWRLTPSCIDRLLSPLELTLVGSQGVESYPHTVFGIGCKGPLTPRQTAGVQRFLKEFPRQLEMLAPRQSGWRRTKQRMANWLRSKGERRRQRDYFASRFWLQMPPESSTAEATVGEAVPLGTRLDMSIE